LSQDQEEATYRFIRNAANAGNRATERQTFNFIRQKFRKTIPFGSMDSFLRRHPGDVRRVIVSPQELPRLHIPRSYLERYLAPIKVWVPPVPADAVFNLDEAGLSD
jgi:hypothetical protein